jgi:hypothetical protein
MRRLLSALVLPLVLAGSLAACGGGASVDTSGATASTGSPSTEVTDTPAAEDRPDGKDLCAYLKKIEPDLKAVGPIGASAQLAMGLADWVEKHPDQKPADSMEMDATTTRACPAVRNAVLKDLDTKTLQEALG